MHPGILHFAAALMMAFAPQGPPADAPAVSSRVIQKPEKLTQLLSVRRIYVDRLAGGDTATQIRDMILSSLYATGLFVVTENPDRADASLRGSAEDLIFTDVRSGNESLNARGSLASGSSSSSSRTGRTNASFSAGESESFRISERRHEASAAVRLVDKSGDVIWATTQESMGGKFRGASADVADKITKQLVSDYQRAKSGSNSRPRSVSEQP